MEKKYSDYFSVTRLVIFSILTFGIYMINWIYRNWNYIKKYTKKDISPGWRTVGLIVPIYGIYLVYDQFRSIIKLVNKEGIKTRWSPGWLTFWLLVLGGITTKIFFKLPDEYIFFDIVLTLIAILPLIPIQNYLNVYWSKTQKSLPIRRTFTTSEVIWIIVGILLWAIMLFV